MILKVKLLVLSPEIGGRQSAVFDGYRPDWLVDHSLRCAKVSVIASIEPGHIGEATLHPAFKDFWVDAVKVGQQLQMYEGPHLVGVAKILEIK